MDDPIRQTLASARIFRSLSPSSLDSLTRNARLRLFRAGLPLMRQGEPSDMMYILASGRVRVERSELARPSAILAELGPGSVVGEMGVLDKQPRSATVVAISDVEAVQLAAEALVEVMLEQPEVNEALRSIVSQRLRDTDALVAHLFADLLRKVPIFQPISADALAHLAERGVRRRFRPGETLMRQGDRSDSLHVIARGRVRVQRSHPDIKDPVVLAMLGPGEVVGEMGVLDAAPRSATVVAADEVETMQLDEAALAQAMLEYPEIATVLLRVVTKRMRSTDALLEELLARGHVPSEASSLAPAR